MNTKDINLIDYYYDLPQDRIAQYPVSERDFSQLLIYKGGKISKDTFRNLDDHLPSDSLLVFNNTRVIRARILFKKPTGAAIEILCLEPLLPFEYELSFGSKDPVEWKCIVGNLKKWKNGKIITAFIIKDRQYNLIAERIGPEGEAWRIRFPGARTGSVFAEVIEATGHIPFRHILTEMMKPPILQISDHLLNHQRICCRTNSRTSFHKSCF